MLTTYLSRQYPGDQYKTWLSEPFIFCEKAKSTLTRKDVILAAEQFRQLVFDGDSNQTLSVLLLYQQRQHFLIALLATAMQQAKAVLPPNLTDKTLSNLRAEMPSMMVLSDDIPSALNGLKHIKSQQIDRLIQTVKSQNSDISAQWLNVTLDSLQASQIWLYTSGSTGQPKKVIKTWQNMMASAELAIERFNLMQPCYLVATVPAQHMFGLETSIFWPLFSRASIFSNKPMFPEEVVQALQANVNQPSMLVSTPLHIKNLVASSSIWPQHLTRLLSATAPLSKTMAVKAESVMGVTVLEVYGSTETASIASRQTVDDELWQSYSGVQFDTKADQTIWVKTKGLDEFHLLHDHIECLDSSYFKLGKRNADLIKVAGKRTSRSEINAHLQEISGIVEGVFIQCEATDRLAVFVVSRLSKPEILSALRKRIDPVFLPRSIVYVASLPKNELGKILYGDLLERLGKPNA